LMESRYRRQRLFTFACRGVLYHDVRRSRIWRVYASRCAERSQALARVCHGTSEPRIPPVSRTDDIPSRILKRGVQTFPDR
jgi:hypothetical protein